jgi:hypothetical protein
MQAYSILFHLWMTLDIWVFVVHFQGTEYEYLKIVKI